MSSPISNYADAFTQYVEVEGIRYAYRSLGKQSELPLVCLQHFTGTLDNWDPIIINGIASERQVITIDNTGVGNSDGATPDNVLDMTREDFSDLLGRARKTLGDLVQREHLSRVDSDLLYRIARAIVHAVSVFEDAGYAVQWLKEPSEALGGATPLSLLATVEGDEVVHAELGAVEHGMPV